MIWGGPGLTRWSLKGTLLFLKRGAPHRREVRHRGPRNRPYGRDLWVASGNHRGLANSQQGEGGGEELSSAQHRVSVKVDLGPRKEHSPASICISA